uniref:Stabilin 2 n=1 Tax=Nothobranchius kuhntae TaxID=321403 RepID=A0A1A8KSS0_NOTKU
MATLPQEQKDFLFHQNNRAQLLEYLKYHILIGQKIYAEGLIYLEPARTLQGSSLSFSCGGLDNIGEIFINDASCRIIRRHLVFRTGIAYGIDCLLTPPSLGGTIQKEVQKCDLPSKFVSKDSGCRPICTVNFWKPKCCHGYYGRDCLVCPGGVHSSCSNHGQCDDGHLGNGTCTCDAGFEGTACELCSSRFYGPTCKACNCSEHGSCDDGQRGTGQCFCEEGWSGDRCDVQQTGVFRCSPPCSPKAVCKENNTCICRPFYVGDGLTCTLVDMCRIRNGGCAKEARCSQSGDKVSCTCPTGFSGDGFVCVTVNPCKSGENGGCHEHALCIMTNPGKRRCSCKNGFVGDGVTCEVKQLPVNRCLQDNGRCHSDATCTDLHHEDRTLGVFHYQSSRGNLLQVLRSSPTLSNFLTQVLNYSQVSQSGRQFVKRLEDPALLSTLFVPDNSGLQDNQTLSQRDIEFHLSEGQILPLSQLRNGTRLRTRVGSLTVLGVSNMLDPSTLSSRFISGRIVTDSDIPASNGIIHILQSPLVAPPPHQEMQVVHRAGMGVGVVLLVVLVSGIIFVGYHFCSRKSKPFHFHYFKDEEEDAAASNGSRSICNPVYEAGLAEPEPIGSEAPVATVEDQHQAVDGCFHDLLQNPDL